MSSSIHSPTFLAAIQRPVGVGRLLLRLALVLPLSLLRLLGHALHWLGTVGDQLVDWHDDWRHEVQVWTCPPVWSELKSLRERCETAEKDAANMRWICEGHKASLERARQMCVEQDLKGVPDWPVIEWSAAMHQQTESEKEAGS